MTTALKPKNTWSFTHQFLTGVTARDWWHLLRDNRHAVDLRYWHRAAFITMMSVINSLYKREEERDFGAAVRATSISEPPIFVLGHWRSGTTHLHNLMTVDERFTFPTVYQATFPHTFLSTEQTIPRAVDRFIPNTRIFDNVAFSLGLPQEDEFAMCIASGYSSLMGMVFPRRTDHYDRYLTLEGVPEGEVRAWKETLRWFLQKLTLAHGSRPIVLKSPPHTARVRLLLELFPNARFVHIVRNPYKVFQSTRHMYDTMVWHTYLQQPDESQINAGILRRYQTMYDAYLSDRELIPRGQLYELTFEDLRRDPLGQMENLYQTLGIDGFAQAEGPLRQYVEGLRDYRQNDYTGIGEDERAMVAAAWSRYFAQWGYDVGR